jgi:hypothetical protein
MHPVLPPALCSAEESESEENDEDEDENVQRWIEDSSELNLVKMTDYANCNCCNCFIC